MKKIKGLWHKFLCWRRGHQFFVISPIGDFGIAALFETSKCARCGVLKVDPPSVCLGIERCEFPWWRNEHTKVVRQLDGTALLKPEEPPISFHGVPIIWDDPEEVSRLEWIDGRLVNVRYPR